jgi:hypothetical protein
MRVRTGATSLDIGRWRRQARAAQRTLSFLLCYPNAKPACLVVIDEVNSGLLEGRLNFQQS